MRLTENQNTLEALTPTERLAHVMYARDMSDLFSDSDKTTLLAIEVAKRMASSKSAINKWSDPIKMGIAAYQIVEGVQEEARNFLCLRKDKLWEDHLGMKPTETKKKTANLKAAETPEQEATPIN